MKKEIIFRIEPCHEKMCLKIVVVVIPKEGLAGGAHQSFCTDATLTRWVVLFKWALPVDMGIYPIFSLRHIFS